MKNNPKKTVHIILFLVTLVTLILLICIWTVSYFGMTSMQGIITKLVYLHVFICLILSGVVYRLSRKYK